MALGADLKDGYSASGFGKLWKYRVVNYFKPHFSYLIYKIWLYGICMRIDLSKELSTDMGLYYGFNLSLNALFLCIRKRMKHGWSLQGELSGISMSPLVHSGDQLSAWF